MAACTTATTAGVRSGVFTAAGTVTVYYRLQLSDDAGQNDGASTQSQLASSAVPGDVHEPGSQTVPVPARDVLQVDNITIYKYIDDSLATTGKFPTTVYVFTKLVVN